MISSTPAGQIYTWTDENGTKHISDFPPDNPSKTLKKHTSKTEQYENPQRSSPTAGFNSENPTVTVEQFPMNITIRRPDSIGTVYMDATYTNNSNRNVVGFQVTILIKDRNEKTYLSTHDTVLPGQTSPKFNSFGPKSLNMNDVEILKYQITIANQDGSKTYINYDNKLKQYN
jgi:hypothetical protein